jgi:hypothetical protein
MASLAESMWATGPETPSISAGQNTKKPSRETRTSGTEAPSRGGAQATRRRGRGGGSAKSTRQAPPPSDVRTSSSSTPATEPSSVTTSEPADVPPFPSTATPRSAPNRKARPKPESARSAGRVVGTATAVAKTFPSEKDENVASEPVSNGIRKTAKKRGGKTLPGPKRKSSLAISVSTSEPLSTIIEPATLISQPAGAIPTSIVAVEETITAPDSPKTSHSSGPETLPPSTPIPDQEHQSLKPLPAVVPDSASIRPLTPASTSHIDWADDDDAGDLPDLDDWGFTPGKPEPEPKPQAQRRKSSGAKATRPAEVPKPKEVVIPVVSEDPQPKVTEIHANSVAIAEESRTIPAEYPPVAAPPSRPKGAQPGPPLTETQMAERKRLRNEKARERRKIKKMASNEGNAVPAPSNSKAAPESQSGIQDVASRLSKVVVDDGKAAASKSTVGASANALPLEPSQPSLPAKPTSSPGTPSNPTSAKAPPPQPTKSSSPSLPARPTHPPTPFSTPPSNSVTPLRRKPFEGEPAFNTSGQQTNIRGRPSTNPRTSRRERPLSTHHAHSASRPVISPNALSQLTKSLSGGTRSHRPTVTAE